MLVGAAAVGGTRSETVAFVLDLTERKRAETEARESERRYREAQMKLAHANRVATMGQLAASSLAGKAPPMPVAAMHVVEGAGAPLIEKVRFAADLYGAFPRTIASRDELQEYLTEFHETRSAERRKPALHRRRCS